MDDVVSSAEWQCQVASIKRMLKEQGVDLPLKHLKAPLTVIVRLTVLVP